MLHFIIIIYHIANAALPSDHPSQRAPPVVTNISKSKHRQQQISATANISNSKHQPRQTLATEGEPIVHSGRKQEEIEKTVTIR